MIFSIVVFLIVEAYLFAYVLIPYLRYDQFQFWDAAGHYFAVWFQRNYLFPNLTGWNPFFFGGYPQGTFYGPIYHYLITLLSFPLGLPLAFKLFTIACIAILPFSIYYLARKFNFDPNESSLMTLLAMIPVAGLSLACGGTLFSQFVVGLGAHALGLPLFLIYFGKLKEQIDKVKSGAIQKISSLDFIFLSILATLIVLTHYVVAFAAVAMALILILNSLHKQIFVFALKHGTAVFLLGGFFLLPFVVYRNVTENASTIGTILSMGFFLSIPLFLLLLLGGAASILDKDRRFDQTYFTLLAVFAVMIFIDFGQIGLLMYAYRFILFFMIIAMMLPVKLVFNNISQKGIKVFFLVSFLLLGGWQLYAMIFSNPRQEVNRNRLFRYQDYKGFLVSYLDKIPLEKLEGRVLLLETRNLPISPRALEHYLAQNTGNYFLKGLFIESTINSNYVNDLHAKVTGLLSRGEGTTNKEKWAFWSQTQVVHKLLKLFQINYLLTEPSLKSLPFTRKVPVYQNQPDFYLYKVGSEKIAEVLPYQPYFVDKNWTASARSWYESPDPKVLVNAKELPKTFASSEDAVEVVEEKISPASLKLKVSAKENIPILIKVSYFPRWRAYVDGKPAKVYRAAPSFMLVYGKGEIKLEYRPTLIDQIGKLLTFIGVAWLFWELYGEKKKYHGKYLK